MWEFLSDLIADGFDRLRYGEDYYLFDYEREQKKREKRELKEIMRLERLERERQEKIDAERRENEKRRHELELYEQEAARQRQIAEQKRQENIRRQEEYAREQEARLADEKRNAIKDEERRRNDETLFRLISELKIGVAKVQDAIDSGNDRIENAVIMSLIDDPIERILRLSDKTSVAQYRDVLKKQQKLLRLCADGIKSNPPLKQRISDCAAALDAVVCR